MKLRKFIQAVEEIAPPELAEEWDNTGLLIEPITPREIQKVLLCIDLTENVAREAIRHKIDLILAYHPVLFSGIKRFTKADPQARTAMKLIHKNIAVYSPHTALDAAPGGVNDWLADAVGEGDLYCAGESSTRIVDLFNPVKLSTLSKRIKQNLRLKQVKTARAKDKPIRTIAICAGAGIEALRDAKADCILTGEMKHHDILHTVASGTSVILCGHTETERGYLRTLRRRLISDTEKAVEISISNEDAAPLKVL